MTATRPNSVRSGSISILFHAASASLHLTCLYYLTFLTPLLPWKVTGHVFGNWKFLTYWNLVAHSIILTLCFFGDLFDSKRFSKLVDLLIYSIAIPIGFFVVLAFWAICLIDPNLVYPIELAIKIGLPLWVNLSVHTSMAPLMIVESYLINHQLPSRKLALSILTVFILSYFVLLMYLGVVGDFWVYPVLERLNIYAKAAFMASCVLICYALYFIGEYLNQLFWNPIKLEKSN